MNVREGARGLLRWALGAAPVPASVPVPGNTWPQDVTVRTGEPGRDHLLSVPSAEQARAALDAAESLAVVDGRATVWTVLAGLAHVGAFVSLFAVLGRDTVTAAVGFLVFVGLLVLSDRCERASGVRLKPPGGRVFLAGLGLGLAAVAAAIAVDLPESAFLGFLVAAFAVPFVVAPIVRWVRSGLRGGSSTWGPGTQALAILTMLDRSQAMTPSYLVARAGLEPGTGARWIERLRAEHLLMGGQQRRRPLGPAWVEITDTGRERLTSMRAELDAQAAAEATLR